MKKSKNFVDYQIQRELKANNVKTLEQNFKVTENFIKRLGLYSELEGHSGCVNCLEWNAAGSLLASGSDDVCVNIFDPFRKKLLVSIPSGHQGNIFSVKFVPNTNDRHIISGAADHIVRVFDISTKETLSLCSCHSGRVKRLATDVISPNLYWSAGEDGLIIQHDFRESHTCTTDSKKAPNILIDLKSYMGQKAEAKCLTVNPTRTEIIGVGANDPFVRLYDRRMIKLQNPQVPGSEGEGLADDGAVQYFAPGHLPRKVTGLKRKYRSVASTFIAFNSNGTELLVNLGGEQIYLFPLTPDLQNTSKKFCFSETSDLLGGESSKESQTLNGYKNGHVTDDKENDASTSFFGKYFEKKPLPPHIELIKNKANEAFEAKKYALAIQLYNQAISIYPNSAVLFGNRGAALLKRAWDGDVYESLKDCYCAISVDPQHYKAHLRLCRCLYELGRYDDSLYSLNQFKAKFPKFASTNSCKSLEEDLLKAIKKASSPSSRSSSSTKSSSSSSMQSPSFDSSDATSSSPQSNESSRDRNFFLRFTSTFGSETSNSDAVSNQGDSDVSFVNDAAVSDTPHSPGSHGGGEESNSSSTREKAKVSKVPKFQESESRFQEKAFDYIERYCGHCNTTTDIKEANFFGTNYIVAGSDDGSFFIWERETTNLVKVIRGDESIVNCLQPHPSICLLATSGIESVIRLWSPMPENDKLNDRVIENWDDVASANQKRMKSNPFELILLNMGYQVNNSGDTDTDDTADLDGPALRCNQT